MRKDNEFFKRIKMDIFSTPFGEEEKLLQDEFKQMEQVDAMNKRIPNRVFESAFAAEDLLLEKEFKGR